VLARPRTVRSPRRQPTFLVGLLLLALALPVPGLPGEALAQVPAAPSPSPSRAATPAPSPARESAPAAIPVAEVATRAAEATNLLRELATQLAPSPAGEAIRKEIPKLRELIDQDLAATASILQGQPSLDVEVQMVAVGEATGALETMLNKIADFYEDEVDEATANLLAILEPVMKVEIYVPEEFAGSVMGDLSSRRGRPQGMEPKGSQQMIKAEVPQSEMLDYDATLTSMTGGRGSYHMDFDHYDEVPSHLQEKIVAAAKAERGGEQKEEE